MIAPYLLVTILINSVARTIIMYFAVLITKNKLLLTTTETNNSRLSEKLWMNPLPLMESGRSLHCSSKPTTASYPSQLNCFHAFTFSEDLFSFDLFAYSWVWGLGRPSGEGTALLLGGSRDRFPVTRDFSGASDSSMCPGVDSASKNEYQDIPGVKDGGCVRVTTLPP